MNHIALLAGAGLLAGVMNALAGGGSFVSLPALIAAGVPSVLANSSSTVALLPGGMASVVAYRKGLGPIAGVALVTLVFVTLAGGMAGALLLLWTPSNTFDSLLPWLLLFATLVLAFGRDLGARLRRSRQVSPALVIGIQFVLGIYGGYFGGAVGLMMLAIWSIFGNSDLKALNAPRTLMVSTANLAAALTFIFARAVRWPETVVMLLAAIAGGYSGAWLGRRLPSRIVRACTLVLTSAITIAFFVRSLKHS